MGIGEKTSPQQREILEEVIEIEHHLHNWERWFGAAVSPSGETHVADRIGITTTAFQIDGGDDTWGAWVQIIGSEDTPADVGMIKYDVHRLQIVAVERGSAEHFVQIAFGDSGADALAAGNYTEFAYRPQSGSLDEGPVLMISKRILAGVKAWARVFVVGENTGTIDFFHGLHEYDS